MQARALPVARGPFWLLLALHLYRSNPPLLSLLAFANLLLLLVASLAQPLGPFMLLLLSPVFVTLTANACAAISKYGLRISHPDLLLQGIRKNFILLLRLGIVQMSYVLLVVIALDALLPEINTQLLTSTVSTPSGSDSATSAALNIDPSQLGILLLHLGLTAAMVLPAFWFAPLLTAWHGVPPFKAVFFSWVAVLRNWRVFLAYAITAGIIGMLLPSILVGVLMMISGTLGSLVASVLQILLLVIFAPMLMAGVYCSYNDIFTNPPHA